VRTTYLTRVQDILSRSYEMISSCTRHINSCPREKNITMSPKGLGTIQYLLYWYM